MKRNRILALAMTVVMSVGLLAGCGSNSSKSDTEPGAGAETEAAQTEKTDRERAPETDGEESDSAKDAVTLEFYIWNDEEPYMRDVVDQFNASQRGITVNLNVIASDSYEEKVQLLMASESGMDIVDLRDMGLTNNYVQSGMMLDITDKISEGNLDISNYGSLLDSSRINDRFYTLPTRATSWVLYYNKDVFDEAGLPYPEQITWEEYAELAQKLQAETSAEYGGLMVTWNYMIAAGQAACYYNSDDVSGIQYAVELANQLYNVDNSHMDIATQNATGADYIKEFEQGHVGLLPNGEWVVGTLLADAASGESDCNWGIAPMPIREGEEDNTTIGGFQFVGITSFCTHPDEAYQFIEYLCSDQGAVTFAKHGMIHAYATDEAKEVYMETCGNDSVQQFFNNKLVLSSPVADGYSEMSTAFSEQAELYLLGEQGIEETMNNFLSRRDQIKAENEK